MACQTISLTLAARSCAITIAGFSTFQLVCPLHTTINSRHPLDRLSGSLHDRSARLDRATTCELFILVPRVFIVSFDRTLSVFGSSNLTSRESLQMTCLLYRLRFLGMLTVTTDERYMALSTGAMISDLRDRAWRVGFWGLCR